MLYQSPIRFRGVESGWPVSLEYTGNPYCVASFISYNNEFLGRGLLSELFMFPVTACVLSCTQYLGYTSKLLLLYLTWLAYYIIWLAYNLVPGVAFTSIK